eukprot:1158794-Pelagomonas_calceolata.AAC.3
MGLSGYTAKSGHTAEHAVIAPRSLGGRRESCICSECYTCLHGVRMEGAAISADPLLSPSAPERFLCPLHKQEDMSLPEGNCLISYLFAPHAEANAAFEMPIP